MNNLELTEEFKRAAEWLILPRLAVAKLHPDVKRLVHAYLGTGPFRAEPYLMPYEDLKLLPCLDEPHKQHRFVLRVLWALLDPAAKEWLPDDFFQGI